MSKAEWFLLGLTLGVGLAVAAHVVCPRCQRQAVAWRRALGLGLIE